MDSISQSTSRKAPGPNEIVVQVRRPGHKQDGKVGTINKLSYFGGPEGPCLGARAREYRRRRVKSSGPSGESIPRGLEACAACGAAGGVVGRTTQGAQVTPRIF